MAHKLWTDEEDRRLAYALDEFILEQASMLGRSRSAIDNRIQRNYVALQIMAKRKPASLTKQKKETTMFDLTKIEGWWAAKDADDAVFLFDIKPEKTVITWDVDGGMMFGLPDGFLSTYLGPWDQSLHQIVNGKLVKHCEFKRGDKVMVSNEKVAWFKRYFSHYEGGMYYCFCDGRSDWTRSSNADLLSWNYCRLPTEEELKC